jgi:hypothetical protein
MILKQTLFIHLTTIAAMKYLPFFLLFLPPLVFGQKWTYNIGTNLLFKREGFFDVQWDKYEYPQVGGQLGLSYSLLPEARVSPFMEADLRFYRTHTFKSSGSPGGFSSYRGNVREWRLYLAPSVRFRLNPVLFIDVGCFLEKAIASKLIGEHSSWFKGGTYTVTIAPIKTAIFDPLNLGLLIKPRFKLTKKGTAAFLGMYYTFKGSPNGQTSIATVAFSTGLNVPLFK